MTSTILSFARLVVPVVMVVALSLPVPAKADIILTANSFDTFLGPVGFEVMGFQPFDSNLGVLNSVIIEINGFIQSSYLPTFTGVVSGPGGIVFTPYSFISEVQHDFIGVLGLPNYKFANPVRYINQFATPGTGDPIIHVTPFSYTMQFTEFSDFLGFTFPSITANNAIPPSWVTGKRSDFIEGLFPFFQIQTLVTSLPILNSAFPVTARSSAKGAMLITYDFTRDSSPPSTTVPEPTTLALFATGFLALGGYQLSNRRRERK